MRSYLKSEIILFRDQILKWFINKIPIIQEYHEINFQSLPLILATVE